MFNLIKQNIFILHCSNLTPVRQKQAICEIIIWYFCVFIIDIFSLWRCSTKGTALRKETHISGEFCEISKNTFFTEHLCAAVSMLFKNLSFCVGYWHVLEYNLGGQTQSTLAKWTAKLRCFGKDLRIFLG